MQDDTSTYTMTRTLRDTCEKKFSFSTTIPTIRLLKYSVECMVGNKNYEFLY